MKGLKRLICYIFSFYLEKFPDSIELPEPSTDLKAWSFQVSKNYFCKLNIERPIAHKVRLSFFYAPCMLIIHSGPVARTVPIKNHGQDSSTSQLRVNQI